MDIDSWNWLKANKFDFIRMSKEIDNDFSAWGENPLHVIGMVHAMLQIGSQRSNSTSWSKKGNGCWV